MPNSPLPPSSKVKNSLVFILSLVAACGPGVCAQSVDDLQIPQRSDFSASIQRRDPMLPIGWSAASPMQATVVNGAPVPVTTESYIRPEAFVVSSISLDKIPLSIINGRACGEGDFIPFVAGGQKIKVQVFAIRDGAVTIRYGAHQIVCPIRPNQKPTPKK